MDVSEKKTKQLLFPCILIANYFVQNEEEEECKAAADGGNAAQVGNFMEYRKSGDGIVAEEVGISASAKDAESPSSRVQEVKNEPPSSAASQLGTITTHEESSKHPVEQEETTPEGFIRRRAPSPARFKFSIFSAFSNCFIGICPRDGSTSAT